MAGKPALRTLQPRVRTADTSRLRPVDTAPAVTERLRGRAGVERRARWLLAYPLCVDCKAEGRTGVAHEVDHEVPLWAGGADDESNFASRCRTHHDAKTRSEAIERAGRR